MLESALRGQNFRPLDHGFEYYPPDLAIFTTSTSPLHWKHDFGCLVSDGLLQPVNIWLEFSTWLIFWAWLSISYLYILILSAQVSHANTLNLACVGEWVWLYFESFRGLWVRKILGVLRVVRIVISVTNVFFINIYYVQFKYFFDLFFGSFEAKWAHAWVFSLRRTLLTLLGLLLYCLSFSYVHSRASIKHLVLNRDAYLFRFMTQGLISNPFILIYIPAEEVVAELRWLALRERPLLGLVGFDERKAFILVNGLINVWYLTVYTFLAYFTTFGAYYYWLLFDGIWSDHY